MHLLIFLGRQIVVCLGFFFLSFFFFFLNTKLPANCQSERRWFEAFPGTSAVRLGSAMLARAALARLGWFV